MSEQPATFRAILERIAQRQRSLALWSKLAACWTAAAIIGLGIALLEQQAGWASSLAVPMVAAIGVIAAIIVVARRKKNAPDWRSLAAKIEARHPELEGRLLTAVQQPSDETQLNYLQQRLVEETVASAAQSDWLQIIPRSRVWIARASHWMAILLFAVVLLGLRVKSGPALLARIAESSSVTVTPGDVSVERGNSLVVFVRFSGPLPPAVELVSASADGSTQHLALVKSLADPIFGGTISDVSTNFAYHIEHANQRTREYKVTVFEYPRLERADVDLTYPAYTAQPRKHIENTKRLSAVEGSTLDLTLQLNKPVASASLVTRDKDHRVLTLQTETNRALATLNGFPLELSHSYDLQLVDFDGRTNKVPAQFVFDVLTNRIPEFRLASPRGDMRPSPIEEISFEGTVWDDFGLQAYGLGYSIPGQETKYIEMGKTVPGKEKKSFQYTLRLEDLHLEADQLIAWFLWADDVGPDGQTRRSAGDLFFGEVRPFEEVFRQGQERDGQAGQSGQQPQGGQSPTAKLTELQKQIISATWKLRRDARPANGGAPVPQPKEASPTRESRNTNIPAERRLMQASHLVPATQVFGQPAGSEPPTSPRVRRNRPSSGDSETSPAGGAHSYSDDATVLRDSQAQALDQVEQMSERANDPKLTILLSAAKKEMEKALANLEKAKSSPATLPEALAAEQAAYQALLKLQQHEYQVMRNQRNQQGSGSSRDQQLQRQLDQMDITQADSRYETQRQAQRPQASEQREQIQVQNRLQELARRQQDLNDRLKELQTAMQEARTEQEREEIRRRLKRLQEEEQQMLNDVDELKQRMERPENQSRMSEERKQLDETRKDVQQAANAANQGSASQALASGTRAQRQLQQLRDQVRKQNSSQFADDLRQMRSDARELSRQQEDILKKLDAETSTQPRSLSDSTNREGAIQQLARQRERMTNLVERATQLSQDAEEAEPVVSRQLYDSVRKFTQDSSKAVKETQEDLLGRGLMTRNVYDRLQDAAESDSSKMLEAASELLKQDLVRPAAQAAEKTRAGVNKLRQGIERAAESVLGDDTEALKLAQQEIDKLTEQLQREILAGQGGAPQTNQLAGTNSVAARNAGTNGQAQASGSRTNGNLAANGTQPTPQSGRDNAGRDAQGNRSEPGQRAQGNPNQDGKQGGEAQANSEQAGNQPSNQGQGQGQTGQGQNAPDQAGQRGGNNPQASDQPANGGQARNGGRRGNNQRQGGYNAGGDDGGDISGSLARSIDRMFNDDDPSAAGPITGENFMPWSDRLRDVEEMVDQPELRNQVATARERARLLRQQFKADRKKPDWAVVQMQVMKPLLEVRDHIADELARRESSDALVPIDRDPVPNRYSDLVRRYYEELGKDK
jgi:hypothetical protein